jgi:flagellar basal-body rod protein FlgF
MSTDLYVAASAQVAQARRMDAIAANIANINTAGYRAGGIRFEAAMAQVGEDSVAFAGEGEAFVVRTQGPINFTGNALDVAVDGEGWLALQSPDGTIYTRDGRFHMTDLGDLVSVNGYPVLDAGGGPVTLDPSAGPVEITESGIISQAGRAVGSIGMFLIAADAKLTRYDNSAVVPDQPVEPVEDFTTSAVRQGYIEGSNVNPILEMTRMIEASRAFDQAAKAMEDSDKRTDEAIRTLPPG